MASVRWIGRTVWHIARALVLSRFFRTRFGRFVLIVLLLAALVLLLSLVLERTKTTEQREQQVTAIRVENHTRGQLRIEPTSADTVELETNRRMLWRQPKVNSQVVEGSLEVKATCPRLNVGTCEASFVLKVPRDVMVTTEGGRVDARGTQAPLKIQSSGAPIALVRTLGRVEVVTKSGDVKGTALGSTDVSVRSTSGEVDLDFADTPSLVDAETVVGDLRVRVPASPNPLNVQAHSQTGRLIVEVPQDAQSPRMMRVVSGAGNVSVVSK